MSRRHPLGKDAPQAKRMRALRKLMGYEDRQRDFAEKFLGLGYRQWNNFENGIPVGAAAADRLIVSIPGISWEWIQRGATGQLSVEMARRLSELDDTPPPASKSRREPRQPVVHKNR